MALPQTEDFLEVLFLVLESYVTVIILSRFRLAIILANTEFSFRSLGNWPRFTRVCSFSSSSKPLFAHPDSFSRCGIFPGISGRHVYVRFPGKYMALANIRKHQMVFGHLNCAARRKTHKAAPPWKWPL